MIRTLAILAVLGGAGVLTAIFTMNGNGWVITLSAGFIILSLIAFFRHWDWVQDAVFFLIMGGIASGMILGYSTTALITSAYLSLVGWDLAAFFRRLELANEYSDKTLLIKYHFFRLGFCLAFGIGLVLLVLNTDLKINFGWMVLLALLAALGLGRVVNRLLSK